MPLDDLFTSSPFLLSAFQATTASQPLPLLLLQQRGQQQCHVDRERLRLAVENELSTLLGLPPSRVEALGADDSSSLTILFQHFLLAFRATITPSVQSLDESSAYAQPSQYQSDLLEWLEKNLSNRGGSSPAGRGGEELEDVRLLYRAWSAASRMTRYEIGEETLCWSCLTFLLEAVKRAKDAVVPSSSYMPAELYTRHHHGHQLQQRLQLQQPKELEPHYRPPILAGSDTASAPYRLKPAIPYRTRPSSSCSASTSSATVAVPTPVVPVEPEVLPSVKAWAAVGNGAESIQGEEMQCFVDGEGGVGAGEETEESGSVTDVWEEEVRRRLEAEGTTSFASMDETDGMGPVGREVGEGVYARKTADEEDVGRAVDCFAHLKVEEYARRRVPDADDALYPYDACYGNISSVLGRLSPSPPRSPSPAPTRNAAEDEGTDGSSSVASLPSFAQLAAREQQSREEERVRKELMVKRARRAYIAGRVVPKWHDGEDAGGGASVHGWSSTSGGSQSTRSLYSPSPPASITPKVLPHYPPQRTYPSSTANSPYPPPSYPPATARQNPPPEPPKKRYTFPNGQRPFWVDMDDIRKAQYKSNLSGLSKHAKQVFDPDGVSLWDRMHGDQRSVGGGGAGGEGWGDSRSKGAGTRGARTEVGWGTSSTRAGSEVGWGDGREVREEGERGWKARSEYSNERGDWRQGGMASGGGGWGKSK